MSYLKPRIKIPKLKKKLKTPAVFVLENPHWQSNCKFETIGIQQRLERELQEKNKISIFFIFTFINSNKFLIVFF